MRIDGKPNPIQKPPIDFSKLIGGNNPIEAAPQGLMGIADTFHIADPNSLIQMIANLPGGESIFNSIGGQLLELLGSRGAANLGRDVVNNAPTDFLMKAAQLVTGSNDPAVLGAVRDTFMQFLKNQSPSEWGNSVLQNIGNQFFQNAPQGAFTDMDPTLTKNFGRALLNEFMQAPTGTAAQDFLKQLSQGDLTQLGKAILDQIGNKDISQVGEKLLNILQDANSGNIGQTLLKNLPENLQNELLQKLPTLGGVNLQDVAKDLLGAIGQGNLKEAANGLLAKYGPQVLENVGGQLLDKIGNKDIASALKSFLGDMSLDNLKNIGTNLLTKYGNDVLGKLFGNKLGIDVNDLTQLIKTKPEELLKQFGSGLLKNVGNGLLKELGINFGQTDGLMGKLSSFVTDKFLGGALGKASGWLKDTLGKAAGPLGAIGSGIVSLLQKGKLTAQNLISTAIDIGVRFIPVFGQAYTALRALPVVGPLIGKAVDWVSNGVVKAGKAIWDGAKKVGETVWNGVKSVGNAIGSAFKSVGNVLKKY